MSENRFELAPMQVKQIVDDLIHKTTDFKHLQDANIVVMFDTKKRMSGGKYVLGRAKKTNDLENALYTDPEGVFQDIDFVLFFDKEVFINVDPEDQIRIVRHELNHCSVNDKGNFIIVPHEITDFHLEIERNVNDPRWLDRVSTIAESIYDRD